MKGSKIVCFFDGEPKLEVEDSTYKDEGMIGVWSKSDAQTYFDDLTVAD